MSGRRAGVVVAAGLMLGGAAAAAVGLAGPEPARVPDTGTRAVADAANGRSQAPATVPATPPPASRATATPSPPAEADAEVIEREPLPVRVRIPAIDVDSKLLHLGLAADASIAVPAGADIDRAAWFDGSPRPGEPGPAVIEGHVDSPNGPSVFFRLAELRPGQKVHVEQEDGSTVTFVVDRVEAYPKARFPTRQVYANTDGPELRVITCGGRWDASVGHYEDNTVVYAHAV